MRKTGRQEEKYEMYNVTTMRIQKKIWTSVRNQTFKTKKNK